MRIALALALFLAGCGSKTDPHAHEVCIKAADRWEPCARELLGDELFEQSAGAKRDIGACERDPRTVAMYEKCLATTTCQELFECVTGEVEK